PDDARHVTDRAAAATHDVVVVVAAKELEPAGGAVGLDATQDPGVGQRVEDVVHGLRGDGADPVVDRGTDLLRGGVRTRCDLGEHCQARCGDPEVGRAQQLGVVGGGHVSTVVVYLEVFKSWDVSEQCARTPRTVPSSGDDHDERRVPRGV